MKPNFLPKQNKTRFPTVQAVMKFAVIKVCCFLHQQNLNFSKEAEEGQKTIPKGSFTNYVYKRRGVGSRSKNIDFLSTFIK